MPSVTLNGADVAIAKLQSLGRQGAVALRQATNDTARTGRTILVRSVTSTLNLKPSYVRERVNLKLAQGSSLEAEIRVRKRDVLLARFDARQVYKSGKGSRTKAGKRRRDGVSVRVKAGGNRSEMPEAFFVTLKNGVRAVAYREARSGGGLSNRRYAPKGGQKRGNYAIDVLYGPSVFQHFKLKMPEIRDELSRKFLAEAQRQYERRLPR